MNQSEIVIIGAGLAGLTAARTLVQQGIRPLLLEATPHVGGRASSIVHKSTIYDQGGWTFVHNSPVHELAVDLGLELEIIDIPVSVARPVAEGMHTSILSQPWSFLGNIVAWMEIPQILRLFCQTRTLPATSADTTAARWANRHYSSAFIADVITPVANLFFLQELDTLSRNQLLATFRYLGSTRLHSFQGGMGQLATSLYESIRHAARLYTSTTATRLESTPEGMLLHARTPTQDISVPVKGCIVATPLPVMRTLLGSVLDQETLEAADTWEYAPSIAAHMELDIDLPEPGLMVLPPRGHSSDFSGATMEQAKSASRCSRKVTPLTLYSRPGKGHQFMTWSDDRLKAHCTSELQRWFGLPAANITCAGLTRWQHGVAFADTEMEPRMQSLKQGLARVRTELPICCCGDYLGSPSLNGAVQSGRKAAQELLRCPGV